MGPWSPEGKSEKVHTGVRPWDHGATECHGAGRAEGAERAGGRGRRGRACTKGPCQRFGWGESVVGSHRSMSGMGGARCVGGRGRANGRACTEALL